MKEDFLCFVDVGKSVLLDESGAKWTQNRKDISVKFTKGDYYPNIVYLGKQYRYRDFFASEHMADLKALAESMLVVLPNEEEDFVESRATIKDQEGFHPVAVVDLLKREVTDLQSHKTKILFIRGEAGLGKTSALRYLTRQTAKNYLVGDTGVLFFYIDAQSKSLARLDEAVAAIIQDLQGRFHYRALALLTRLGLVVPIIDGFDELIGLGGYGEAFDSLTRFISRLDASGAVIASARSTFYEYSGIRNKVIRYESIGDIDYELDEIELLRWDEAEIIKYIKKRMDLSDSDASQYYSNLSKKVLDNERELIKVPFFLSTIINIDASDNSINTDERLIIRIIDHFIERESKKLLNKNGQVLLEKEAHYAFLTQIAEEMWWSEATEIDVETIKLAAEIFADAYISQREERIAFIEKSPTYAFWRTSLENSKKFMFTHEYYYSFFTASFIYDYMRDGNDINQILNRATISQTIVDEFSYKVSLQAKEKEIIALLSNRKIPYISSEGNQENAGTMTSSILSKADVIENFDLKNVSFINKVFSNKKIINCSLSNLKFSNCDFTNTIFENTTVTDCIFIKPHISREKTNFGGIDLKIGENLLGCVVNTDTGDRREVYNPSELSEICQSINVSVETSDNQIIPAPNNKKRYELALKFIKISRKYYYVSDDDLRNSGISKNSDWKDVEEIFLKNKIIEFKRIDKQGSNTIVRKLNYTPDIVLQSELRFEQNDDLSSFWKDIYR